ncbi:MAG: terminase large subunit domain-containing protein [Shimia sp.]
MTEPVIKFLPYQQKWIEDASRFNIGMFSRRAGKTFGCCGEITNDCIDAEIEGRRTRWTILSRSERTAKEAMEDALKPMVKAFYAVYGALAKQGQPEFSEEDFHVPAHARTVRQGGQVLKMEVAEATYKAQEVRFPGGSRVTAISASPDAARGFGGNLFLDEFAFHANARAIWSSAFPVAARGGHLIRVVSTPNGKGNKYHELMTADGGNWSRHVVDIYDAVRQGLDVDIEELRAGMADQDAWAQEFELAWLDAASAWLPYDLISTCEAPFAGHPSAYRGGAVYVGVDIAIRKDLFVIWILEEVGGILVTREIVAERRVSFARQEELLDDVFRRYRVLRCAMDQTGMGEPVVERAKARHGSTRVEGVLFNNTSKLELATGFKEAFEDRSIRIPEGDPILRADLHAIRSVASATGLRRLVADGDTDGHADRFWAGAMAVGAGSVAHQAYAYHQVSRASPADDRDIKVTAGFGAREGVW